MENVTVRHIFLALSEGLPVHEVRETTALKGQGLSGDRYASGTGAFSNAVRKTIRQVSLIAYAAVEAANKKAEIPFQPGDTRRNIVLDGISADELNDLVGKTFWVGEALLKGIEKCTPCDRPSKLSGKQGFKGAFENHGGLRAEVIETGIIRVGDSLEMTKDSSW